MTTTPTLRDAAQAGPCPFCGSAAIKHKYDSTHWVGCSSCYSSSTQFDTEEQALAAWHRRAALAAPADTTGLAHEIWAVAQLTPGEGIEDGAARVEALLIANSVTEAAPADALAEPVAFEVRTLGRQHGEWQACTKELYEETLRTGLYAGWPNAPAAEVRSLVPATQLQQAVARARKEEQEIMHGLLRPVVVEAIRGMRGAPDIEENGKSLVTEIEDVFRAAIHAKGQQ